jgi:hypothetical protein
VLVLGGWRDYLFLMRADASFERLLLARRCE